MALKFQYNKTALQELNRQLRIRQTALPTLKNREAALRSEVKKARDEANAWEERIRQRMEAFDSMVALWEEFDPSLVGVERLVTGARKVAGVGTKVLEEVVFRDHPFSMFSAPHWIADGMAALKELTRLTIERNFALRRMEVLDEARKKTTQKVNLYEKVQIPEYEEAIRKIKRYLEDEENLAKAAQKIVKKRKEEL